MPKTNLVEDTFADHLDLTALGVALGRLAGRGRRERRNCSLRGERPSRLTDATDGSGVTIEELLRRLGELTDFGIDPELAIRHLHEQEWPIPALDELEAFEDQLWRCFLATSPTLTENRPHAQLIVWAWVARTYRHAHMAFFLMQLGFADGAAVHARAAVEHGVYASLLSAGSAMTTSCSTRSTTRSLRVPSVLSSRGTSKGTLRNSSSACFKRSPVTRSAPNTNGPPLQSGSADRLQTGDRVYLHYRMLSDLVHAGFGSAGAFLLAGAAAGSVERPALLHEPLVPYIRTVLWLAVGACAWAGWSADRIFGTTHFKHTLDPTAREFGFRPLDPTTTGA